MALISVVVPIYNVEAYLEKCINSIINQTFSDLEILLIDDGSTDSSSDICDRYGSMDTRIKVLHKKNGGLSSARNAGIDLSKGDYLCFIDSDDYIDERYIERLYFALKDSNADISMCNFIKVDENYDGLLPGPLLLKDEVISRDEFFERIDGDEGYGYSVAWNKLYSRKALSGVSFPEGKIHEDEFAIHMFVNNCESIAIINEPLYFYLQRTGSIMSSKTSIKQMDYAEALSFRVSFYISIGYYRTLSTLLNRLMVFYYRRRASLKKEPRIRELDACVKKAIREARPHLNSKGQKLLSFFPTLSPLLFGTYRWLRRRRVVRFLYRIGRSLLEKRKNCHSSCLDFLGGFRKEKKKCILLDTPSHGNLGDQAICEAEKQLILKIGCDPFFEFTHEEWKKHWRSIMRCVGPEDTIFLPGGGFLGSLWPNEQKIVIHILKKMRRNRIIIFPQTVFFDVTSEKEVKTFVNACNNCSNLTVFVREKKSLNAMNQMGLGKITKLVPDAVLTYEIEIGFHEVKNRRILLCLRQDKEKTANLDYIESLLHESGYSFDRISTIERYGISSDNRRYFIENKIRTISRYPLMITDRLHGMVFSLLANTPCVAFDNLSGKISGVCEWVKQNDSGVVCFDNNHKLSIKDIEMMIGKNVVFDSKKYQNLILKELEGCFADE